METLEEQETYTCNGCEAEIDRDTDWYDFGIDGETYCDECHRCDLDTASSVIFYQPECEPVKVLVGSFFVVDGEYFEEWDGVGVSSKWKSTDGWRGHAQTTIDGWAEVLDGWTTGWADGTTQRKVSLNDWIEKSLPECPIPVALIFDRTSNVFSMGIGIAVPDGCESDFREWLGDDLFEDLHGWLG